MDIIDVLIIGGGPAGLSAAVYAGRAGMKTVILEKLSPGGQVMSTSEVENYPGFAEAIGGWELVSGMEAQARRFGAEIVSAEISSFDKTTDGLFVVHTAGQDYQARSVIIATGSTFRKLGIPGEIELIGRGVSYCGTCDGAFFRDRVVAVIGGGNTALEEADFLTRFASKVYLIHRRSEFRGEKVLQQKVSANSKIEIILDTIPLKVNGQNNVQSLSLRNVQTGGETDLNVDGVFIFVGYDPNNGAIPAELLDEQGQVLVDLNMRTPWPGVYAAGDVRHQSRRQIIAAAGDGAIAAMSAYEHVSGNER